MVLFLHHNKRRIIAALGSSVRIGTRTNEEPEGYNITHVNTLFFIVK